MSEEVIERFYGAFARRDGDAMADCYAPDARFTDPVFKRLRGEQPGAMWRMLTAQARDLEVELLEHDAHETWGTARWRATYTFTQTGHPVVNDVFAAFRFNPDGLIAEHADSFNFRRWARQALTRGTRLLGWPLLRAVVRHRAKQSLARFIAGDRA